MMIHSELAKIRYTKASVVLGLIVVVVTALSSLGTVFLPTILKALVGLNDVIPNATEAGELNAEQMQMLSFSTAGAQWAVIDVVGSQGFGLSVAGLCAVVFGLLNVTSEYRHGSIANSVLQHPQRLGIVGAKAAAVSLSILLVSVLLVLVSAIALGVGLVSQDTPLLFSAGAIALAWIKGAAVLVLLGLFGMGLGLVLRNQVAGVLVIFGWMMIETVARPIAAWIFGSVSPASFLPLGLANDVVRGAGLLGEMPMTASLGSGLAL
ncbi:MAG: hypothetical protein ABWX96_09160, partial [Propionibacteriaceae bacterium]